MQNILELLNHHRRYQKSQHALDTKPPPKQELELSPSVSSDPPKTHYVFFKEITRSTSLTKRAASALSTADIDTAPSAVYGAINGFSIPLTPKQADALRQSPGISSVEADNPLPLSPPIEVKPIDPVTRSKTNALNQAVGLDNIWVNREASQKGQSLQPGEGIEPSSLPSYGNGKASSGEVLPYGVKAVLGGVDVSSKGNVGAGTYAFVIDSGVLNTTSDLNINTAWSKSWVSGESALTDGNGHDTHVAGTIAALANGKGVVGVAPGAKVISLKVFDSSGGGASYSTIIDAINYATEVINTNGLDKSKVVINMSLGGGFSHGLDTAVKNAANQGIKFAIAAGNSGADADGYSPASAGDHQNVYTVSAVDNVYQMPWWSNWDDQSGGDDVDIAAPGVGVYSYYKGGQLASLSGTSMAAPHVAGLLLMGGVKKGDMVKAASGGASDPFELIQSNNETPTDPQPDPDPTPPPNEDGYLYLGATTGGSTINISNQSGSLQQRNLEAKLGLKAGVLDTSLKGTKKAINATEGSAFQATGEGKAGDSITFSFNFKSTEYLPYADYAFYAINQNVYSLADLGIDTANGGSKQGDFTYTLSRKDFGGKNSGAFKFSASVVDAIDNNFDSLLSINTFTINRATNHTKGKSILGKSGSDLMVGGDLNDTFYGYSGNDTLNGGSGSDTAQFSSRSNRINLNTSNWQNTGDGTDRLISIENVNAGSGNDSVKGNRVANVLNGQAGNDRLYGAAGNDQLTGGTGKDRLYGGSGKDRLSGGSSNDHLYGGNGNDLLIGGGGKDRVWGQAGRDTFRIQSGTGYTIIKDFSDGADRIQLGSGSSGLKLKTRGDDVLIYQRRDLMAIVEDAAGDLQRRGRHLG